MNLAVLERMARNGDMSKDAMRYLLDCRGECEWLDYKEDLNLGDEKHLCDFTKDVLALKNVGGGFLIIGVEDKTWRPIGLNTELQFDTKMLRDQLRRASNVEIDIDIVHHKIDVPGSTNIFCLIFVRSSRKRNRRRTPTIVGKDFCANKPFGIRRGDIYFRKGDSTVKVLSEHELADLLDDLEARADQDALDTSGHLSPFAVEDGTYRLLEKGFESFIGRETLKQALLLAVHKDPRIWIVNVHGPGGVGKSALVNWAVYEFYRKGDFESIIHLTAKETMLTPMGITRFGRSLYSLENLLDHILNTFQEKPPDDLEIKKRIAIEILSTWSTLLVLDNMETVQDGRILALIQNLPVDTKAKVLMTSRTRTGAWELPVSVDELSVDETQDFMNVKSKELEIKCPCDGEMTTRVWQATGGLPLAIQWVIGRCRIEGSIERAIEAVGKKDSPVLEYSFRNIWSILSSDAKSILGAMTIFDEPPTVQQLSVAMAFNIETIEKALGELCDVTLVNKNTQSSDGRIRYSALPITLSFAQNQLHTMGDFELECRQRYQRYNEQMKLQESELFRFRNTFDRYGLETDNEKKSAILCQRGLSEMSIGNVSNADMLYKQARELAPNCAYVFAMSASYDLARNRIGQAIGHIDEAIKRSTVKTMALCYTIKARILDVHRDHYGRVQALESALLYEPEDMVVRHQYGVALSRAGKTEKAIEQFDVIINKQKDKSPPSNQLLMALKTRLINLGRLGRKKDMEADLTWLDELFKKYPHLSVEAKEFDEFRN
jgi:tetratricopeptide (TPR) repeat protein